MALVYQKRKYGTVSHTYKCTTYMRNKDYCPRPNTLLHRQIKSIVERELRDLMFVFRFDKNLCISPVKKTHTIIDKTQLLV